MVKFIKTILFGCETQSLIAVLTLYGGFNVFSSVSNGSRLLLQVRVHIQTELLPYWWFELSINLNLKLGYRLMVNLQPI